MSMLNIQCDNLQLMARLVREYDYAEISRMLREAADTIDGLRDKLQADVLGSGTLTAEQVRKAIFDCSTYASYDGCTYYASGIRPQAIADELNAELGSGTCKITATATDNLMNTDYMTKWYELSCGHSMKLKGDEAPKWCAVCGKKVEQ